MSDSDSDDENIVRYGTPLEPYEEDEVPAKKKFQQQQEFAVDAHGRRRFHGAFTGGFSAGYGNTVGTPEGWAPATFKSSRSEKAQVSSQRPEDFMDEEDRSEYGIAPRLLQTKSDFSGQKRQRQQQFYDGSIPGEPVLHQLVRAVHETAAVRMLKAMGWRQGQGAGERVTSKEKQRAEERHRVYGCYMPPEMRDKNQSQDEEDNSSDSEVDYDTLFAPDDYEPYILHKKNDRFGLGYSGLSRHSVLGNLVGEYGSKAGTSKSHLLMKDKNKKVSIRGQAFGVGAFEADDEDIYATADMSHYDFALGGPSEKLKPKRSEKMTNVLDGFLKATAPLPTVPSYPPPALPRDYKPAAAGSRRSRFEPTTDKPRDQGLGRHELTADARGALLGETPIPRISPEPEILTNLNDTEPEAATEKTQNLITPTKEIDFIPINVTGGLLQNVFKPFKSDPKKQIRYELYLKDKERAFDGDQSIDRLSEWERNREMAEFEQAAKLYKPLSGIMEERFTHASQPDEAVNPLCAVAKSENRHGLATPEQVEAAKIGAFGMMTRTEKPWRPEGLICKRFNIPEPGTTREEPKRGDEPKVSYSIFSYLESSVHDKETFAKEQSKFSGSKSLNIDANIPKRKQEQVIPSNNEKNNEVKVDKEETKTTFEASVNKRMTVAELFLKESEKDINKNQTVSETIEKFDKMDLYKSIFLSDSEDEDENDNAITVTNNEKPVTVTSDNEYVEKPKNVGRNSSPPRGIFANIDFDELNMWRRNTDKSDKTGTDTKNAVTTDKEKDETNKNESNSTEVTADELIYGPKIPENLKKRLQEPKVIDQKPIFRSKEDREAQTTDSSDDSWVEAKKVKTKKEKRKKSKKEKHKSKHKSKHKKKDR